VEQTLVNLLSNALKFSPRGGRVQVRAACASEAEGRAVHLEVLDQGPGVEPADRARIFKPFEQTQAGQEAGGAGLGLAICAGNAALMRGDVGTDRSASGETRFWFSFPAAAHAPVSGEAGQDEAPEPVPARPLRVLAAEDNAANRQVLTVLLQPAELELTFAVNGAEAVEATARSRFDLILMDANMPVMDGVSAVREIRARDGEAVPPIFMLTANVFEDDVRLYLQAGVEGVLKKPVDVRELYGALSYAAERGSASAAPPARRSLA
jgi:CheY-like chemotaxis protein